MMILINWDNTFPYNADMPLYNPGSLNTAYPMYPCPYMASMPMLYPGCANPWPGQYVPYFSNEDDGNYIQLKDYGTDPFAVNIEKAAEQNNTFRTALWTGKHLQLTLMSLNVGEDIGLEVHPNLDQFIRVEEGQGVVMMGDSRDNLNFRRRVGENYAFIIPAGKWHNLINTGNRPLKLYSIYAPPQHPHGTVHKTKADAQAAEAGHKL